MNFLIVTFPVAAILFCASPFSIIFAPGLQTMKG